MFRWHTCKDTVNLHNPGDLSNFQDVTLKGLFIPVYMQAEVQTVRSANDTDLFSQPQERTEKRVEMWTFVGNRGPKLVSSKASEVSRDVRGRHSGLLPSVILPIGTLAPKSKDCWMEAIKTGAHNASAVAAMGAVVGLVVGGPPTSLAGAQYGAIIGGSSAVCQLVATQRSNRFRELAGDCNGVLFRARQEGISPMVLLRFGDICTKAGGQKELDLCCQVVEEFEATFGDQAAAGLRAQYIAARTRAGLAAI